jgi:hypothetical protein
VRPQHVGDQSVDERTRDPCADERAGDDRPTQRVERRVDVEVEAGFLIAPVEASGDQGL